MSVTVKIDQVALGQLLSSPTGLVAKDLARRAERVRNRAVDLCPVDQGRLRSSITWELAAVTGGTRGSGGRFLKAGISARVGSNVEYAEAVERGTGVYGPTGQPIRPRKASVLIFTPKGSPKPVAARQVRGRRATPYLVPALPAAL